jgi:hypothetical protein
MGCTKMELGKQNNSVCIIRERIAASNANSKVNATVASIKLENNLITAFSMQMNEMCILIILGLIVAQLSINNQAPKHTHTHTQAQPAGLRKAGCRLYLQSQYPKMKKVHA